MNKVEILKYLNNTMSLRSPQSKSLYIFADYIESKIGEYVLNRKKNSKSLAVLESLTREYVNSENKLKKFDKFERKFPSYTFSLATGVGKTRLMGAFVAYLFHAFNIKHFLIVAPGNTIYRKLVEDFSDSSKPKFVFKGIESLSPTKVKLITKDNYQQTGNKSLFHNNLEINIFNIQQFSQQEVENRKGITKFDEYLGESYFDYLKSLDDLVVLMDESHHYSSDSNLKSLDRIDPLFGLEFTATPYVADSKKKTKLIEKRNLFYFYSLGDAIRDSYVKEPWIGTEADINFKEWDPDKTETDIRKLELATFFHERAKSNLIKYSEENKKKLIKPVLLVVAKDIDHADEIKNIIENKNKKFRDGRYIGKVITVHTKQKGKAEDEMIEKLISLESVDNNTEIVIHVNMLKEGWDVSNIYTIAPLRASAAQILTEQTIGRGLRLPYGIRTGNAIVDKVVIVAHENYAKVIEQAKNSELIKPSNIEYIVKEDVKLIKDPIKVKNIVISKTEDEIKKNSELMETLQYSENDIFFNEIESNNKELNISTKVERLAEHLSTRSQNINNEIEKFILNKLNKNEISNIINKTDLLLYKFQINIPKIVFDHEFGEFIIEDFNLNTDELTKFSSETIIKEQSLQSDNSNSVITAIETLGGDIDINPFNKLVTILQEFSLIDYDEHKDILIKLVTQAIDFYKTIYKENVFKKVFKANCNIIANEIYEQILKHKLYKKESSLITNIKENPLGILPHNISISKQDKIVSLDSQYNTFSRNKYYGEFKKAAHEIYIFDSSDEARFAYLMEKDNDVLKWLRPSPKQFEGLYWRDEKGENLHNYEPDFVVETDQSIFLVEIKPEKNLKDYDVMQKKLVAQKFCDLINKNINNYGIEKNWVYTLISTNNILANSSIKNLLKSN